MKILVELLSNIPDSELKEIQIQGTTLVWSKKFYNTLLSDPVKAITMYARRKGKTITEVVHELNKVYATLLKFLTQEKYLKTNFSTDGPCCINCFGFCFHFYAKSWIDTSTGSLRGEACPNFVSKDELIKIFQTQTGSVCFHTLPDDILKFALIYDKGYVLWRNLKYNSKVLDKREVPEIISGLIKIRDNISDSNKLSFSLLENEGFLINNISPIRGETYTEYFRRCQKEVRKINIRRSKELLSLPEEEVVSKLNDYFLKSNLG